MKPDVLYRLEFHKPVRHVVGDETFHGKAVFQRDVRASRLVGFIRKLYDHGYLITRLVIPPAREE